MRFSPKLKLEVRYDTNKSSVSNGIIPSNGVAGKKGCKVVTDVDIIDKLDFLF